MVVLMAGPVKSTHAELDILFQDVKIRVGCSRKDIYFECLKCFTEKDRSELENLIWLIKKLDKCDAVAFTQNYENCKVCRALKAVAEIMGKVII